VLTRCYRNVLAMMLYNLANMCG